MREKTYESWEDDQILSLLDEMADVSDEDPQGVLTGADSEAAGVRRAYIESLALLPFELEAVSASETLKARVLRKVAGEQQQRPGGRPVGEKVRAPRSSPSWLLPLAAMFAFALVGVTGWQIWRVEKQAETIAQLSRELDQARMETAELVAAREQVVEARARLDMMMASTAEYCPLRPTRSCPNQEARGTLVMRSDEKDWFLRVEGLGPCERGRQYKLWFVTASDLVLGASFAVQGAHDMVEIRATGAPAGVEAVMITLEEPHIEAAPEAEALLYGDQRMRIL